MAKKNLTMAKKNDLNYRELLLSFIGSLTLAEHMGDVAEDVQEVLNRLGITDDWEDLSELGDILGRMGVKTIYGTGLISEEDDDDE